MEHYAFTVPSVWEHSTQLRFGIDTCVHRIRGADRKEVLLLQHLRMGISHASLQRVAQRLRLSRSRVETLLERLEPVLCTPHSDAQLLPRIAIYDDYLSGHRIGHALHREGFISVDPSSLQAHVAVTVDRFGYDADRIALLNAHDIRVFPVRITDGSVTFGPLVDGENICGRCLQLHCFDVQPIWLRWQEQLVGKEIPIERTRTMDAIAPLGASFLRNIVETQTPGRSFTITLSPEGGVRDLKYQDVLAHDACEHVSKQLQGLLTPSVA